MLGTTVDYLFIGKTQEYQEYRASRRLSFLLKTSEFFQHKYL